MLHSDRDIRSTINRMMPNASDKIKVGVTVVLENLQGKSMGNDWSQQIMLTTRKVWHLVFRYFAYP